jgi:hypothetical protein
VASDGILQVHARAVDRHDHQVLVGRWICETHGSFSVVGIMAPGEGTSMVMLDHEAGREVGQGLVRASVLS